MLTMRDAALAVSLLCLGIVCTDGQAAPPAGNTPSFNCDGPDLSVTEIQICANDELARYDRELTSLYQAKLHGASPADRQTLMQDQRAWLQRRDACAGSVDCIKGAYLTKIYDLQTASVASPVYSSAPTPMPASSAGDSQAAQVNAAIPPSSAAQAALSRARRTITDKRMLSGIEAQLAVKMNLRALNCIQNLNIAPGLPPQQLHDSYSGDPCFAKQDDDIAAWLGMRTVGYILTLPALRAMPSAAPQSITDRAGSLALAFFAAQAGVAVIQSATDVEVIDLARDVPISSRSRQDDLLTGVSPNGRIYVSSTNKGLRFYGSEDGMLLADPGLNSNATACGFPWLDPMTMWARDPNSYSTSVLYDFASGTYTPADSSLINITCFLPVPGTGDTSVAFGSALTRFRLAHGADGKPRIEVLQARQAADRTYFSRDSTALTAGGRQFVYVADRKLGITDLSDLSTQVVDFGNYDLERVWATDDPDRIIIRGVIKHGHRKKSANGEEPLYVYAVKERTLSEIDTAALPSQRFVYDPVLNALYVIKDAALTRVHDMYAGAPESLDAFAAEAAQAEQAAVMPAYNVNTLPSGLRIITVGGENGNSTATDGAPTASSTSPEPTSSTPPLDTLHQLAKVSAVEGAGVFDPDTTASASPGGATVIRPGAAALKIVHLRIFPGRRRPLMLVLTSQSPVTWQIEGTAGGQLVAVLLSGASGSTVLGQGSAQVVNIGSAYAVVYGGFESSGMSPGYQDLQKEVYRYTGERISLFQGGTANTIFNVP